MRDRVGAVGGVQEQHARLAVMVRLAGDLLEQLARPHGLMDFDRHTGGFRLLERAAETLVFGMT